MHPDITLRRSDSKIELFQQCLKPNFARGLVYDQPKRPILGMRAHENNAFLKARVTHAGHRDQKLTIKGIADLFHIPSDWGKDASHQGILHHTHDALPECDFPNSISSGYSLVMLKNLVTSLAIAFGAPALGQSSGLPIEGELLSGWREASGEHISGVALRLAPGWKTYWRAPGAGGIPPSFNWSGSSNLASVEVLYPVPKVMVQNGLKSIGYDSDVVFPLIITAKDRTAPVRLRAEIEVGVCEEVCIPMTLRLSARLPARGSYDASIGNSLDNQPAQGGSFACEITPISDGLRLRAETDNARIRADIVVVETASPDVWVSPSVTVQKGRTLVANVEMVPPNAQPFALARSEVQMTLIGEGRAVEMKGCE